MSELTEEDYYTILEALQAIREVLSKPEHEPYRATDKIIGVNDEIRA